MVFVNHFPPQKDQQAAGGGGAAEAPSAARRAERQRERRRGGCAAAPCGASLRAGGAPSVKVFEGKEEVKKVKFC